MICPLASSSFALFHKPSEHSYIADFKEIQTIDLRQKFKKIPNNSTSLVDLNTPSHRGLNSHILELHVLYRLHFSGAKTLNRFF